MLREILHWSESLQHGPPLGKPVVSKLCAKYSAVAANVTYHRASRWHALPAAFQDRK
jgi:hypothetical protein